MNRRLVYRLLLVVALAILVVVVIVVAVVPAKRFVYGVAPLGPDSAILLTRHNDDTSTFWVQHVRADGTVLWSADQTPFWTDESLGFTSVLATEDTIILLGESGYSSQAVTAVRAISRATGEPIWETPIATGEMHYIGTTLHLDGPRLYVIHTHTVDERTTETLTALKLSDGKVLWTLPPVSEPSRLHVTLVAPARLLVAGYGGRAVELDGVTGQERAAPPLHYISCLTPDHIVATYHGDLSLLVRAQPGEDRAQAAAPNTVDLDVHFAPRSICGTYDGDLIHGVTKDVIQLGLVRVDPASGAVRWRVWLPGRRLFEETHTADGRLPRFAPVTVFGSEVPDAPTVHELVIIDLETGAIVSVNPTPHLLTAFTTDDRGFAMAPYARTLFALDRATGALSKATRFPGLSANYAAAQDFRYGQLWMTGMGYARPGSLNWAVIDLATGGPLHLNGEAQAVDVTAEGWGATP